MSILGGLLVFGGLITSIVWGVLFTISKISDKKELNVTEQRLGYYGFGAILLGLLLSDPTLGGLGGVLFLAGLVGMIIWLIRFLMAKFGNKEPMTKVAKGVGIGAASVFLFGMVIGGASAVDADKKSENVAAQVAKADSEKAEKEKAESEAKSKSESEKKAKEKSESEAKEKSEAKAKEKSESEAKVKAESEAKAKSESETKVKAESEAKAKAESEAKQEEERAAQAAKQEEKRVTAAQQQAVAKPAAVQAEPQVNNAQGAIIGNSRSMIYHVPGGRSYNRVAPHNQVIFNSEAEAQAAGYRRAQN